MKKAVVLFTAAAMIVAVSACGMGENAPYIEEKTTSFVENEEAAHFGDEYFDKVNILDNMQDGMGNEEIKEVYKQDIDDVMTMTTAKGISIGYYHVDLNDDSYMDKIVIVASPLHSGSGGDSLDFLINDKAGGYEILSNYVMDLFRDDRRMYISDNKTNGYYDIMIFFDDDEKVRLLSFENGKYDLQILSYAEWAESLENESR